MSVADRHQRWSSSRLQAICGITGGLLLAFCAWAGTGALTKLITPEEAQFARDVAPWAANAVLPTPVPGDCDAGPNAVAYKALKRHRPDVLKFYAQSGFNPDTQCRAAFDDWTSHGEQGRPPTTVALYAAAQGWIPQLTPTPTPTPEPPPADCKAPADVVASAEFDPYTMLARKRPDVLLLYKNNGWDPQTKCVAIYDDWLAHGEQGRPPTTAVLYAAAQGWTAQQTPTPTLTPRVGILARLTGAPTPTPTPTPTPSPTSTPTSTQTPSPTSTPPPTPTPTPTPTAKCEAPIAFVASIRPDLYAILAKARPDVWQFYQKNGWDPRAECMAIYDDWLDHGEQGRFPMTIVQYAAEQGWLPQATPTPASTRRHSPLPTRTPKPVLTRTPTPVLTPTPKRTPKPAATQKTAASAGRL